MTVNGEFSTGNPGQTLPWPSFSDADPDWVGPEPSVLLALISAAQEPVAMSVAGCIEELAAIEAAKARLDDEQVRLLAWLDAEDVSGRDIVVEEVAAALRLSANTALSRLKTARTLVDDLPATLASLEAGVLSWRHAQAITATSWTLPASLVPLLEDRVAGDATELTVTELNRLLRREVLRLDPAGGGRRHEQARAQRFARRYSGDDGMAELRVYAPAPEIEAAYTRIDAAARQLRQLRTDDPGAVPGAPVENPVGGDQADPVIGAHERAVQLDQYRADVTLAAIMAGIEPGQLPAKQQGQAAARVQLTMPLSSLLGLDDEPGHLDGHGAIPAAMARRLATHPDSTWHRLLTDPESGRLLDYGRSTYRPPADLRDYVIARDSVCAFPGCQQPAHLGDLDHIREWDRDSGETNRGNMSVLCRRHHVLKSRYGWAYLANPDGSWTWTSPIGRTYLTRPPRRWTHPTEPAAEQGDSDHSQLVDRTASTGFHPGDPISYVGWLKLAEARPHVPTEVAPPSANDDPPF